jgi:hypothetical protein
MEHSKGRNSLRRLAAPGQRITTYLKKSLALLGAVAGHKWERESFRTWLSTKPIPIFLQDQFYAVGSFALISIRSNFQMFS